PGTPIADAVGGGGAIRPSCRSRGDRASVNVMDRCDVSVVVPTYRRSEFLERAVRSVFDQSLQTWELIVVDDNGGGTTYREQTSERVRPFLADPRVRYIPHATNQGGSAARNTGIREARADYVAFLDDDDEWLPDKLARQVEAFRQHDEDVALVCTSFFRIDESKGTCTISRPRLVEPLERELLMLNVIGPTSTVMCRRAALLAIDGFDDELPAMQDMDLFLRLALRYRLVLVDEPLVRYHTHEAGNIGKDLANATTARRIFAAKYKQLIEADPKVRRHRLEEDAEIHFRANEPQEAAPRFAALLRLAPYRMDVLALLVLARLDLCEETTRARGAWGRFRRGLARLVRSRRSETRAAE
ncbi:MAG: glycosyltransferase, partial [Thioalkalivibrio sp.]|nr:glycosyltransferase [Thioalkalivibrio sp.]